MVHAVYYSELVIHYTDYIIYMLDYNVLCTCHVTWITVPLDGNTLVLYQPVPEWTHTWAGTEISHYEL